MFIDQGSPVEVKAGRLAGRFGVVNKIRIESETAYTMVFVDLFNPETGGVEVMLFEPQELKRRRWSDHDNIAFIGLQDSPELAQIAHEIQERKAA